MKKATVTGVGGWYTFRNAHWRWRERLGKGKEKKTRKKNAPIQNQGLDSTLHFIQHYIVLHQAQHLQLICDVQRLVRIDHTSLRNGQADQSTTGAYLETANLMSSQISNH